MLSLCESLLLYRYAVPVHYFDSAIRANRHILANIECRPPCVRKLRAFLAHDVIPQTIMSFLWIYGLNVSKTGEYGRLSTWDSLCYLACPLARQMAGAHDQHPWRMPVFHDVWNCSSDKGFSNTHLADAHHAVLSPQCFNRCLDGISLGLEGRA